MAEVTLPVALSTRKNAWHGLPGGLGQTGVAPAAVDGREWMAQPAVSRRSPRASAVHVIKRRVWSFSCARPGFNTHPTFPTLHFVRFKRMAVTFTKRSQVC